MTAQEGVLTLADYEKDDYLNVPDRVRALYAQRSQDVELAKEIQVDLAVMEVRLFREYDGKRSAESRPFEKERGFAAKGSELFFPEALGIPLSELFLFEESGKVVMARPDDLLVNPDIPRIARRNAIFTIGNFAGDLDEKGREEEFHSVVGMFDQLGISWELYYWIEETSRRVNWGGEDRDNWLADLYVATLAYCGRENITLQEYFDSNEDVSADDAIRSMYEEGRRDVGWAKDLVVKLAVGEIRGIRDQSQGAYSFEGFEQFYLRALGISDEYINYSEDGWVVLASPEDVVLMPDIERLVLRHIDVEIRNLIFYFCEDSEEASDEIEHNYNQFGVSWNFFHSVEDTSRKFGWDGKEVRESLGRIYVATLAQCGGEPWD